jgi:hypothetical protein
MLDRVHELIDEIESIDGQAYNLAMIAAQHPALRDRMTETVKALREQLHEAAAELQNASIIIYQSLSEQISMVLLDLDFAEVETDKMSPRLLEFIEAERLRIQRRNERYDKDFPLPEDVRNLQRTLKSDTLIFQTTLGMGDIAKFYRGAFAELGLPERVLIAFPDREYTNLIFEGLPNGRIIVVGIIDLAYGTDQDLRNVTIQTQEDTWEPSHQTN